MEKELDNPSISELRDSLTGVLRYVSKKGGDGISFSPHDMAILAVDEATGDLYELTSIGVERPDPVGPRSRTAEPILFLRMSRQ